MLSSGDLRSDLGSAGSSHHLPWINLSICKTDIMAVLGGSDNIIAPGHSYTGTGTQSLLFSRSVLFNSWRPRGL